MPHRQLSLQRLHFVYSLLSVYRDCILYIQFTEIAFCVVECTFETGDFCRRAIVRCHSRTQRVGAISLDVHSTAFLQCSSESEQSQEVHSIFVEDQDSSPEFTLTPDSSFAVLEAYRFWGWLKL